MSKEAVQWAMNDAPMLRTDRGKPDTTSRHVLACLAEHAHADGRSAYPSVPLLQYKSGYSRRTVQDALGRLEAAGLIEATGVRHGCTIWALALHLKRPATDKAEIDAETEQRRAATAERVRRHRAKDVTPLDDVTVTRSNGVTDRDVTQSDGVRNAVEQRYVTPSVAPKPVEEPVGKSLSSHLPQQARPSVVGSSEERDTDTTKIYDAWTAARGRPGSAATEASIRRTAAELLERGWQVADVIDLAEHMARHDPSFTDLARHEPFWQPARADPVLETCDRCRDSQPRPGWVEVWNPTTHTERLERCTHQPAAA